MLDGAATSRDISHSGMFIETTLPLRHGARLRLRLTLPAPASTTIDVEAEVRWMGPDGGGVRFTRGLRAEEAWGLNRFLFS